MADNVLYSTGPSGPEDFRKKTSKKKEKPQGLPSGIKEDGIIRIQRQSKGRGGKTVSIIYGLPLKGEQLSAFAKKIKQKCGTGGSVKDNTIIIQGDKADSIVQFLSEEGYKAKKI